MEVDGAEIKEEVSFFCFVLFLPVIIIIRILVSHLPFVYFLYFSTELVHHCVLHALIHTAAKLLILTPLNNRTLVSWYDNRVIYFCFLFLLKFLKFLLKTFLIPNVLIR